MGPLQGGGNLFSLPGGIMFSIGGGKPFTIYSYMKFLP